MAKKTQGKMSKDNKIGKYNNTTGINDDYIDQSMIEMFEEWNVVDPEKHNRFVQEIENCLDIISEQLVALRRLSDTEMYEYKPGEIARAFDEIENGVRTAKTAYLLEGTNISLYQHNYDNKDRPIICLETREVFTSIPKAAMYTGINGGNINSAVHNKLKTAGGYHWEYHMPMLRYLPTNDFKEKWANKRIIDSADGTKYPSVKDAAAKTRLTEDIIFEAILNNKPYVEGEEQNKLTAIYMHVNNHTFQRIVEK